MCLTCAGMGWNSVLSLARTPPWQPGGRLDGTRAAPRFPDPRRIPRPRGDVRALPHADQDLARLSGPSQAALVERGRYLFAVASCALCDGVDSAGGAKLSWRLLGTMWARNLTPDRETGLGAWTDEEIARAIRGGIAKGGGRSTAGEHLGPRVELGRGRRVGADRVPARASFGAPVQPGDVTAGGR
jgi:hypothetical protein